MSCSGRSPGPPTRCSSCSTHQRQNAIAGRVFTKSIGCTGVILTKLDGTAKGGVVALRAPRRSPPREVHRRRRGHRRPPAFDRRYLRRLAVHLNRWEAHGLGGWGGVSDAPKAEGPVAALGNGVPGLEDSTQPPRIAPGEFSYRALLTPFLLPGQGVLQAFTTLSLHGTAPSTNCPSCASARPKE